MKAAVLFMLCLLLPLRAQGAPCRADLNGNGHTDVSDLVAAVGEVLNGCGDAVQPSPTPTQPAAGDTCPYKFNQAVTADRFCGYTGPAQTTCQSGDFEISSGWTTADTDVIAIVADRSGAIGIDARRTSPTMASVTSIAPGPNFDTPVAATGSLSLPSASQFNVGFSTSSSCGNLTHQGTFVMLLGGGGSKAAQPSVEALREALRDGSGVATDSADDTPARLRALLRALQSR